MSAPRRRNGLHNVIDFAAIDAAFATYWRRRNTVMAPLLIPLEERRAQLRVRSVQGGDPVRRPSPGTAADEAPAASGAASPATEARTAAPPGAAHQETRSVRP